MQRHVIDIVSNIDKDRFDITGVCPPRDLVKGVSRDKESFCAAFERIGVRVHPLKMRREIRPISDLAAFIRLYLFIKKQRFDVVHAHSSKAGFIARIAARIAGVPAIVYTPNNFTFDRPGRMTAKRRFFALLERFAGLFCDKVMAVCGDEKDLAARLGVLPAKKIAVISNVIDTSRLNFNVDMAAKREELGIGLEERLVVSVGRVAEQKSPKDFILAAERVLGKNKNTRFLFLGDGPLLYKARSLVEKKGLQGYIRLPGWRNDAAEVIAASDLFVLSSLWEVLPNHSLLDAMALGKPAIITATSGAREVVFDGVNGYVVPVGRPDLLADFILHLLELPLNQLQEFGRRSKEMFKERPGPREIARIIENTYLEILTGKKILI